MYFSVCFSAKYVQKPKNLRCWDMPWPGDLHACMLKDVIESLKR